MLRVIVACLLALLLSQTYALSSCGTYTVVSGDTLNGIAAKYGNTFTAAQICSLNALSDCNSIDIGQVLQVPCPAGACGKYTVVSGDTLSGIAANLSNCNDIDIGEVLYVPCGTTTATTTAHAASTTTTSTHATTAATTTTHSTTSTATTSASSTTGSTPTWPNGPLKEDNIDGGHQSDLQQMVDAGYNLILLAFHVSGQPLYAASVWQGLGATTQQAVIAYAHARNARIVVSAGGADDSPYGAFSGTTYGTNVANFAKNNHLDGVDFDLENFGGDFKAGGMTTAQTVAWVSAATNAARNILGTSAVITHAPQPPYFGANHGFANGYTLVYQQAPSINYLLVQYYNNDNDFPSYSSIFQSDTGGAVTEIANGGIPLNKIVVGKPVESGDASGYVAPATLHTFFTQAQTQYGWTGGVMGWVWHDATTNGNWIKAIYPS